MKRVGDLWPGVVSFDNLVRAAHRAAAGKRTAATVARFMERLEPEVLRLKRELEDGTWRPGRPFTFVVKDPKVRTISAAPFRDRVVHHALIDPMEPLLDRRMVFESFACRRGKGQHRALRHAQRMLRRHQRFLKLDVRKCFDSIGHDVVMETMTRILKDRRVLTLIEGIVRVNDTGVGLPIGNLTSQWFANLVLGRLDHFVKEEIRVPGYIRYMDDFVLFDDDAERLRAAHGEVAAFLADTLGLTLKDRATVHAPYTAGLPYLGWIIHRGTMRLRPDNLRRTRSRIEQRRRQYRRQDIGERQLADSVRSVIAHLRAGSTLALRRRWTESMQE